LRGEEGEEQEEEDVWHMLQRTEPMVHFWHLSRTNPWAQAGRPLETQGFEVAIVVFILSIDLWLLWLMKVVVCE